MELIDIIRKQSEGTELFLTDFDLKNLESDFEIFDILKKVLRKMSVKRGRMVYDYETLLEINKLQKKVVELLSSGEYSKNVKALIQNFDNIEDLSLDFAALLNDQDSYSFLKKNLAPIKKGFIEDISSSLASADSIKINITGGIRKILLRAATFGNTVDEAEDLLRGYVLADAKKGGLLTRYARQIAHDSLFQYQGSVEQKIGEEIGVNAYSYVGPLKTTSRPQCKRWINILNGVIPFDKLEDEIQWAKNNGSGLGDLKLTVKTFPIIRGGHQCIHRAIPFVNNPKTKSKLDKIQNKRQKVLDEANQLAKDRLKERSQKLYDSYFKN
jgi:hypothetical protein